MAQDQLEDELQKIRNIPTRISNFASRVLHATPPQSDPELHPSGGGSDIVESDAGRKYMDAAAPKPKPTPTPKPPTPKPKVPVYHKGTDNVPKTGPAILKKGEAVLNTDDAAKYRKEKGKTMASTMEHAAHALGGHKEEKPKKEIKEIRVRKSHDGKSHIIEHHHTHPEHHPMEEHTTKGDDELAEHMMTHMGTPNDGEADADAGNSGIPEEAAAGNGAAPAGAASMPPSGAPGME